MKKKEILQLEQAGYDLDFLARVQPQGNLKCHGRYLEFGDGYLTCLRVWKYPSHGMSAFWGVPLTSDNSTMAVISIGTEDRDQILQQISKAATEEKTRISNKAKEMDNISSAGAYGDQMRLIQKITQRNEVMKRMYIRVFVYVPTLEELDEKAKAIIRKNGMMRLARYSDEQLSEYESIFVPAMHQDEMLNHPQGTPIDAENLAGAYPFNHVKLEDPNGSYYGYTRTSGEVMFDPFKRDNRRTRSFFFVTGNSGMGKSTLLKKLNDDVFSRGAFIRNFAITDEYKKQTQHQGGVTINLDEANCRINPFQVFPTVVDENGNVSETNSFAQHVVKLQNLFRFLNEEANSDDVGLLGRWIYEFYEEQNLWVRNANQALEKPNITGLKREQYPTLQDFVLFINEKQRATERDPRIHLTNNTVTSMNRIVQTFDTLHETRPEMFDGRTNFPDLSSTQVVSFNLEGLKAQGQGIFNAQVYSVLTLLSADIIKNGNRQRHMISDGTLRPEDVTWYYLNLDEVQNIINPRFSFGVEFLASMMEEMRKNLCAMTMAAPTIKDLIMGGSSHDPYVIAVQKIFSLFQIRFFFQISDDDLPRLSTALGQSATLDELANLPKLEKTECLMNINGDRNIQFRVQITPDEEKRYTGGM